MSAALLVVPTTSQAARHDDYIVGGSDATTCAFPAVASLGTADPGNSTPSYLCTGTLVHPRVMVYAAHCENLIFASFGETGNGVYVDTIVKTGTNPDYSSVTEEDLDWAYAVFAADVPGVPIVPLAAGCELDELQVDGHEVYLAGFSPNTAPPPKQTARGAVLQSFDTSLLRWTTSTLSVVNDGVLQAGGNGKHACGGDSGGPLLAKLADGSWRTIGITSTIWGSCNTDGAYNHWSRVRPAMITWLESETGIDLTPCYDDDGGYVESDACDDFMAYAGDPTDPEGAWDDNCAGAATESVAAVCADSGGDTSTDETDTSDGSETGDSTTSAESSEDDTTEPDESDETTTDPPSTGDDDDDDDDDAETVEPDESDETDETDASSTDTWTATSATTSESFDTTAVGQDPPKQVLPGAQKHHKGGCMSGQEMSSGQGWAIVAMVVLAALPRRRRRSG